MKYLTHPKSQSESCRGGEVLGISFGRKLERQATKTLIVYWGRRRGGGRRGYKGEGKGRGRGEGEGEERERNE